MKDETAQMGAVASLDTDALTAVFDEYASAIYKYLLRLGLDSQEADQMVGDVFVRILDKFAERAGPCTNLRSYLFQIAYHLVVDNSRDKQHFAVIDDIDTVKDENLSIHAQAEEKMLFENLSEAMNSYLTDEQRYVLVLRFQEDFSLKETAKIIGKNVNAVKALQNRGINNLRRVFGHEGWCGQ